MDPCEQYLDLISADLDGQLTPSQKDALQHHLDHCPRCRALARSLEEVHTAASALEEVAPPPGFAQGVMARIRAEETRKPKVIPLWRRPQFRALTGTAACLVLCLGLIRFTGLGQPKAEPMAAGENAAYVADSARQVPDQSAVSPSSLSESEDAAVPFTGTAEAAQEDAPLVLLRLPQDVELSAVTWTAREDGTMEGTAEPDLFRQVRQAAREQQLLLPPDEDPGENPVWILVCSPGS